VPNFVQNAHSYRPLNEFVFRGLLYRELVTYLNIFFLQISGTQTHTSFNAVALWDTQMRNYDWSQKQCRPSTPCAAYEQVRRNCTVKYFV